MNLKYLMVGLALLLIVLPTSVYAYKVYIPSYGMTFDKSDRYGLSITINSNNTKIKCSHDGWAGSNESCDMVQIMQNFIIMQQNTELIRQMKLNNCLVYDVNNLGDSECFKKYGEISQ